MATNEAFQRPKTLKELSDWTHSSIVSFGYNLADFEHTLQNIRTKESLCQSILEAPRLLRSRIPQGDVADAGEHWEDGRRRQGA